MGLEAFFSYLQVCIYRLPWGLKLLYLQVCPGPGRVCGQFLSQSKFYEAIRILSVVRSFLIIENFMLTASSSESCPGTIYGAEGCGHFKMRRIPFFPCSPADDPLVLSSPSQTVLSITPPIFDLYVGLYSPQTVNDAREQKSRGQKGLGEPFCH